MRRDGYTIAAAIGILAMAVTAGAEEPAFIFTSIDVPEAVATGANGINAGGEVVGFYRDQQNRQHGYVLERRGFRTLDFPEAALTDARGISPDGEIVGAYRMAGEPTVNFHGYRVTRDGQYLPVDVAGHINTIAQRIGPDGTVYGCYHDADQMDSMHGIAVRGGEADVLDMSMTMNNGATPDGGTIVGLYTDMDTGRGRGYLLRGMEFIPFDVPGSRFTAGWDINPAGEVVGVFQDANARFHGFLMDDGTFTTLDFPEATATRAFGINPRGDVVGTYVDRSNRTHGFLARRIVAED